MARFYAPTTIFFDEIDAPGALKASEFLCFQQRERERDIYIYIYTYIYIYMEVYKQTLMHIYTQFYVSPQIEAGQID